MKNKLLTLIGLRYCIMCGNYKLFFLGKVLRWRDDPHISYLAFTCHKCIQSYREE